MSRSASKETIARVIEVLQQEADLDGVVTATDRYIGEKVGINHTHAWLVIHILLERGDLKLLDKDLGVRNVRVMQLSDELLA